MEGKQSCEHTIKIIEHCTIAFIVLIHFDLCGVIRCASFGGAHSFIHFIDDFNHFTWLYFLKEKFQTLQAFKSFYTKVELYFTPFKLLVLCSDHKQEYVPKKFLTFCIEANIIHKLIQAYTPSHNGILKKKNVNSLRRLAWWWLMHRPHNFLRWMWSTLQIILQN